MNATRPAGPALGQGPKPENRPPPGAASPAWAISVSPEVLTVITASVPPWPMPKLRAEGDVVVVVDRHPFGEADHHLPVGRERARPGQHLQIARSGDEDPAQRRAVVQRHREGDRRRGC